MKFFNAKLVSSASYENGISARYIASGTLSGSFSCTPVNIVTALGFSLSVDTTGSLSGALGLYASNDPGDVRNGVPITVNSWSLIPGTLQQFLSSSNGFYDLDGQHFKWLQPRWVHNSGTGSINISFTAKGYGN